jgi:endonuclease YncB( thermonuclease family)
MNTPEGQLAKDYVRQWLGVLEPWDVLLYTRKDKREKYGRYRGEIYRDGRKLNEDLVDAGHAVRYIP